MVLHRLAIVPVCIKRTFAIWKVVARSKPGPDLDCSRTRLQVGKRRFVAALGNVERLPRDLQLFVRWHHQHGDGRRIG